MYEEGGPNSFEVSALSADTSVLTASSVTSRTSMSPSRKGGIAETIERPALDDIDDTLPPEERLRILTERAKLFFEEQRYDDAIDARVQILALTRLLYGSTSLEAGKSLWELSGLYMETGSAEQAAAHLKKSFRIINSSKDSEQAKSLLPNLFLTMGVCETILAKYRGAYRYLKDAFRASEELHGVDHPSTFPIYFAAGKLFTYQQRNEKALKFFEKAWEVRDNEGAAPSMDIAEVHREIGEIHKKLGSTLDAYSNFKTAFGMFKDLSADEMMLAEMGTELGFMGSQLDDDDNALQFLKDAADIYIANDVLEGPHSVVSLRRKIASVYSKKDMMDNAIDELEELSKLVRVRLGPDSVAFACISEDLGDLYVKDGDDESALSLFLKSQRIFELSSEPDVASAKRVGQKIRSIERGSNRLSKSEQLWESDGEDEDTLDDFEPPNVSDITHDEDAEASALV